MGLNQITLQGKLVKELDFQRVVNSFVCHNSVAVQRNYANQNKEYETDFFEIELWASSENAVNYIKNNFHKGSNILISGELRTTTYTANDGSKRTRTFVKVNDTFKTDFKKSQPVETVQQAPQQKQKASIPDFPNVDVNSDLPF